jgi:hypothetical protein
MTYSSTIYILFFCSFHGVAEKYTPNKKAQTLIGGTCAGMFGAVFNTPGDVIRYPHPTPPDALRSDRVTHKKRLVPKPSRSVNTKTRSAIQKKALSTAPVKLPFSPALMAGGVSDFFAMGGEILKAKGVQGLWSGFGYPPTHAAAISLYMKGALTRLSCVLVCRFKAMHLGGSGALLALLIPMFTEAMADKALL